MKQTHIAIIGVGAAGLTFLRSFVDLLVTHKLNTVKISLFEHRAMLGTGVAYQHDLPHLLINKPAETMSANSESANEFYSWLQLNEHYLYHTITESVAATAQHSYSSRTIFGFYLNFLFKKIQAKARLHHIEINIVPHFVVNITESTPYTLLLKNGKTYTANAIILSPGMNEPTDHYHLSSFPHYINNPYPLFKKISAIPAKATIGIIGNSLTAFDICLALSSRGHQGPLTLISRRNLAPKIRGKTSAYSYQYCTDEEVLKIKDKKGAFTLRDALRIFRKELKNSGITWQSLFSNRTKHQTFQTLLIDEIKAAKAGERVWQSILLHSNKVVELFWRHLDIASKQLFLQYFHRFWLNIRTPIPLTTACHLLTMIKNQQLTLVSSVKHIQYHAALKKFIVSSRDQSPLFCDYIINASGPASHIESSNELLFNLLQAGTVKAHPLGGLDVDPESLSIINQQNQINPFIKLLGHSTTGVFYYTSSLEIIAKQANRASESLFNFILENSSHEQKPSIRSDHSYLHSIASPSLR